MALALRPLLLLLAPLVLAFLGAVASTKPHALLLLGLAAATPLLSAPLFLHLAGGPSGAGVGVVMGTLAPPELWMPAAAPGGGSDVSMWAASPLFALLETAPGGWSHVGGEWRWTTQVAGAAASASVEEDVGSDAGIAAYLGPALLLTATLLASYRAVKQPQALR